jgi:hypothetical protein
MGSGLVIDWAVIFEIKMYVLKTYDDREYKDHLGSYPCMMLIVAVWVTSTVLVYVSVHV